MILVAVKLHLSGRQKGRIFMLAPKVGPGFLLLFCFWETILWPWHVGRSSSAPSYSVPWLSWGNRRTQKATLVTPVSRKVAFQQSLLEGCNWVLAGAGCLYFPTAKLTFQKHSNTRLRKEYQILLFSIFKSYIEAAYFWTKMNMHRWQ